MIQLLDTRPTHATMMRRLSHRYIALGAVVTAYIQTLFLEVFFTEALVSEERFEEGGVAGYGYGYSYEGHIEWEDLGGELGGEHGEISAIQADDHNRYRNSSVPVSSNSDSRNPLLIVPKAVGLSNKSDIF